MIKMSVFVFLFTLLIPDFVYAWNCESCPRSVFSGRIECLAYQRINCKTYHYCVVNEFSSGRIRCNDCKTKGIGGAVGQRHCKGWSVGYDFIQNKPTTPGGNDDVYRTVLYGKCEEEKNVSSCTSIIGE